jgi:hypothetical protein
MEHLTTLAITDYEIDAQIPTLAKVIVSFTGKFTKDSLRTAMLAKFDNRVAPVEDSFREVRAGVGVGFLRANREVRMVDPKELRASYRAVGSSNIMMSEVDNSLWEVRDGKSGKYLARHGSDDLSELVHASVNRRPDIPGLRHLSLGSVARGEFASFVNKAGDMDHGFVLAANDEKVKVVSYTTQMPVIVPHAMVTALSRVPLPRSFCQKMATAGISREDKAQATEYWTQLYSYNPNYLKDVIDQVNEGTLA